MHLSMHNKRLKIMQALKPILSTFLLGLLSIASCFAQTDHCDMYSGILLKGDSLYQTGNFLAAIKSYRAARVACPSKVFETDARIERVVQNLHQMKEKAIQRRDEVIQKMSVLEKDLQRARYNEEMAEKKERMQRQIAEQNKAEVASREQPGNQNTSPIEQKNPWELLRTGHFQEALPILESAAFTDQQDSLSLMRLAHANLFNGKIETAESIYRILKPLPYRKGNYNSFAEAYLNDFKAFENAESVLGSGKVIPLPIRNAYLQIRTDLENYVQALALAEQERLRPKTKSMEEDAHTSPKPENSIASTTEIKIETSIEKSTAAPAPVKDTASSVSVIAPKEQPTADAITPPNESSTVESSPKPMEKTNEALASTTEKGSTKTRYSTSSRNKLEEDRPMPPAPEFVLKTLINTEIENKTNRTIPKTGEPSAYIVFIGDFDLNDYYAQRTLKRARDQYGIKEARIRYFDEVLKYRILLAEFATKEEAAQYTLDFEQKHAERAWMGVLY